VLMSHMRVVAQGLNDAGALIEIAPEFTDIEEVQFSAGIPEPLADA
jgi:hypothetical protein